MSAPSETAATWRPRLAGPSRSSSAPRRLRGGRRFGRPDRGADAGGPQARSSTRARVRDRVWRSAQRRSVADVRPATRSSAPRVARERAQARQACADGSRPRRPGERQAGRSAERPRAAGGPAASRGPSPGGGASAGRGPGRRRPRPASAAARCRTQGPAARPRSASAAQRDGEDVRGVAVVGERARASAAPRPRRRRAGRRRWPGGSTRRPGPPARPDGARPTRRRSRVPNGVSSGGSRRTTTASAPAARNPRRWCSASARRAASRRAHERSRVGRQLRREDEDGDGRHRPSLAMGGGGPWRGCGRTSGSGRTWATRRRPWPPRSTRWPRSPACGMRGVSRLYATDPVGVLDQPEFRNAVVALDVPAGPDPADRRLGAAGRAQGAGAGVRPPAAASAGVRARWTSTCSCSGGTGWSVERPRPGGSADPAKASLPLVVPHVEARNRLFVLAPLSDLAPALRPAGLGRDRGDGGGPAARLEGAAAARPIGVWDGAGWATTLSRRRPRQARPAPSPAPGPRRGPTGGRRAAGPGRTCGRCPRTGPAWSGTPSPASGSSPRRRRTGRPGAARHP